MKPFECEYARKMDGFLAKNGLGDQANPIAVFHAVRRVPYGSRGGRSPEEVLQQNEGSCSGKHILLRDLLRHLKQSADIETVQGDFAAALSAHPSMPADLQKYCKVGGVVDFHHYVVWESSDGAKKLDATWPDNVIAMGISGNENWIGEGDTRLALVPEKSLGFTENVPELKEQLLDSLSADEREYRAKFLTLLTDWVAAIDCGGEAK
ncbi:MAG: transglutaminase domain-containing protein [Hyphomicrobiales bacterium]